jgi:hypothetical protein
VSNQMLMITVGLDDPDLLLADIILDENGLPLLLSAHLSPPGTAEIHLRCDGHHVLLLCGISIWQHLLLPADLHGLVVRNVHVRFACETATDPV